MQSPPDKERRMAKLNRSYPAPLPDEEAARNELAVEGIAFADVKKACLGPDGSLSIVMEDGADSWQLDMPQGGDLSFRIILALKALGFRIEGAKCPPCFSGAHSGKL
ncbi:MAG: hypothetical protein B7Z37_21030 [Verrucomicrobia bacterium 12-59-8]|nr:MAG: hypothetical protein B7Z37_21030 [Verrucomicrobia bacterium 12-59-8]